MARSSSQSERRRLRRRSRSSSRSSDDRSSESDGGNRPGSRREESLSFEHLEAIRGVALITRNEYPLLHLSRDRLYKSDDADAECYCMFPRPDEPQTSRCDDVSCLNFATYIECNPSRCAAGKFCRNQRLQHPHRFSVLEAFKTEHKGFGVRARDEIKQGTVIGEYVGEIIDEKEMQRRLASVPRQELNFYYLALEPGVYIDARNKGSFTRFMNHSCEPNCKTEKWTVNGEIRIAVLAIRSIAEGEELTFDYQWKSLGSQQIKCYCGAVSCKGVIGSEVDATKTVVDNSSVQGFFREPTKDEIADAIVGRRIRRFLTSTDTSVYSIASVKEYYPDTEEYELVYEDFDGTPEENSFGTPTSDGNDAAQDQLVRTPRVKLGDSNWHLYVELDGMSSDQIEQVVFSIPKRRPSGTSSEAGASSADSPSKLELSAATTSPSQSPTTPSSTPGQTTTPATQYYERRDQDGELLDADGDIVTTKLLIKGLPPNCDEALLRRTLVAPRRAPVSMLERLQSNLMAKTNTTNIIGSLDFFFFDDAGGWALIEFSDPAYPKMFRRNLNTRLLHDKQLRVFLAGRKEVENYERAKRNSTIRRYDVNPEDASKASIDRTRENAPAVRPRTYPYGRALNWLVSVDQAEDSPTRRKGTSALAEERMRLKYVNTVVHIAKRLHLEREDTTSAVMSLHRYFTFRPMNPSKSIECIAAGMLHLYLKANSRKFSWSEFVRELYVARYPNEKDVRISSHSDLFKTCERQILETEYELLEGLMFELTCSHTYALLGMIATTSKRHPQLVAVAIPNEVHKEVKYLTSEVLLLPVWVHTSAECVALSIYYVAAATVHALTFTTNPSLAFAPGPVPGFLPFLDPVESEKDVLALLECSLCIVEGLKDRWRRLEKQNKDGRAAASSSELIDVEQFAVRRHKPVEITQRLTLTLKAWIDLQGIERYQTTYSVKMNDLKLPSLVEERRIKVNDALTHKVSAVKNSHAMPRRIHVHEITEVEMIRKRAYLGRISAALEEYELAGSPVFAQPWPYQEKEALIDEFGATSKAAMRELTNAITATLRAPQLFLPLLGIVFPDERDAMDMSMVFEDGSDKKNSLRSKSYYFLFEQPLHLYSGLLEAKIAVPAQLRKKTIFDMLTALSLCHEWGYVHRYVSTTNLFVFAGGVRLGGLHTMRKVAPKNDNRYELSDTDRKEHFHGSCLHISPPEVLLGERQYSWRGDIWSAGCVALAILFDDIPFFQGKDAREQLHLIYRMAGTPPIEWEAACRLSNYATHKPRKEFKRRIKKTLMEHCEKRSADKVTATELAIDLLDAMLHLDPSKRMSARKLLKMEYFAEFRQGSNVDFSTLPPSFDALKKKLLQGPSKPYVSSSSGSGSSKRRRVPSDGDRTTVSAVSSPSVDRRPRHHSSSSSRLRSSSAEDVAMTEGMEDDAGLVPLPMMLQASAVIDSQESHSHRASSSSSSSVKRAKLGWGMGLNS